MRKTMYSFLAILNCFLCIGQGSVEILTTAQVPPAAAPTPTAAVPDVISIYGDTYTNIATNYNPNWGQTGFTQVNPAFSVGGGNVVLAYPNFNYQGTELTTVNASAMEFLHVDIWTNANPAASIIQVSPINSGPGATGAAETLVTINHTAGQWTSVDIPKSAFTGMTWDSVFQLKFAANGPGSTVPITIYLDNIYFWKAPTVVVPTTQLRTNFCGVTLPTLNRNIFADGVMGATAYRFKVVNGMNEQIIERPDNRFSMGFVSNTMLGTTYQVSVAARVSGVWGAYGAACGVTTSSLVPITKLKNEFCNVTLSEINQNVFADLVIGASGYKFKVSNGMNEQEIERPDNRFSLGFAAGTTAGTTYQVAVAVEFNGTYGAYGTVCNVTTPITVPTSQLRPQFCGATVPSVGSNFFAVFRAGATAYRFKTMINGSEVVVERPNSRCFMSAFEGATMNQTYSIQVSVGFNGVFSQYGEACNITVGAMAPRWITDEAQDNFEVKAYPNPFTNAVTIALAIENTTSNIAVYDMTGKLIQQMTTSENEVSIGENLTAGIYIVQVTQGQETKNIRVVKQ